MEIMNTAVGVDGVEETLHATEKGCNTVVACNIPPGKLMPFDSSFITVSDYNC
jgi:hypothetical protein